MRWTRMLLITSITSTLFSCADCEQYSKEFRVKSFHFKIDHKERENKFIIIKGISPTGKREELKRVGLSDLFDNASVGDILVKEKGGLKVTLIRGKQKKDIPCGCDNKYVDKPVWYTDKAVN